MLLLTAQVRTYFTQNGEMVAGSHLNRTESPYITKEKEMKRAQFLVAQTIVLAAVSAGTCFSAVGEEKEMTSIELDEIASKVLEDTTRSQIENLKLILDRL